MTASSILQTARKYVAAGFSVLPIALDGTKGPASNRLPLIYDENEGRNKHKWEPFAACKPTDEELTRLFAEGVGVGVIHGAVSGNSEALDFDEPGLGNEYRNLLKSSGAGDLAERLVWIDTPSGGAQAWYRCTEAPKGNHHLAKRADGKKARIETRGERGYTVAPGSPAACHPTGKTYRVVHGKLSNLPVLTPEERDILHGFASVFNLYVEPEQVYREPQAPRLSGDGLRPGDDYNLRGPILELLQGQGWHISRNGKFLRRPGKTKGYSATFDVAAPRCFYVFTGSTEFEVKRGYTPFSVYALLEHAGDCHTAAQALYQQGYGDRREPEKRPSEDASRWIVPEEAADDAKDEDILEEAPAAAFDDVPEILAGPEGGADEEEETCGAPEPASSPVPCPNEVPAPLPQTSAEAPHKPLEGVLPDIANLWKRLPVTVTADGLIVHVEANAQQRKQIFKCAARLQTDTAFWLNFAVADAANALPGDHQRKNEHINKYYKGKATRYRQLKSIGRRWPRELRRTKSWTFYEVTAPIEDPDTRLTFLARWEKGEFTSTKELRAEVSVVLAAQKERRERREAAEERQHQRRVQELMPDDETGSATPYAASSTTAVATLPAAALPAILQELRAVSMGSADEQASIGMEHVHAELDGLAALGYGPHELYAILRQLRPAPVSDERENVHPKNTENPSYIPRDEQEQMALWVEPENAAKNSENEIEFVQPVEQTPLENTEPPCLCDTGALLCPRCDNPPVSGLLSLPVCDLRETLPDTAPDVPPPSDADCPPPSLMPYYEDAVSSLSVEQVFLNCLHPGQPLLIGPLLYVAQQAGYDIDAAEVALSYLEKLGKIEHMADERGRACFERWQCVDTSARLKFSVSSADLASALRPFAPVLAALSAGTLPKSRVTLPDGADVMNLYNYVREQRRLYEEEPGRRVKVLAELALCQQWYECRQSEGGAAAAGAV